MASVFQVRSDGAFEVVDGAPVANGDSYSLGFVFEFAAATATGLPVTITTSPIQVESTQFGVNPIPVDPFSAEITFGTYIAGTEIASPAVELLDGGSTVVGTVGFDFYFQPGSLPFEITALTTGEDLFQAGMFVDFDPSWTTPVLGYSDALGLSDLVVVPEPGVSVFMIAAAAVALLQRFRWPRWGGAR